MILQGLLSTGAAGAAQHGGMASLLRFLVFVVSMTCPAVAAAQSADEGRAIYERRCSVCHGDQGSGAYWASSSIDPPPRDFTRTDSQVVSREAMIDAVAYGRKGTAMTAWSGRLSSEQIAAVVDFIRAEFMTGHGEASGKIASVTPFPGGLVGNAAKGGVFFHANCAECHGHAGNGRGRRADMMVYKPLDFTSAETKQAFNRARLFVSIARGVPGTSMPAWLTVLSSQQIADVTEYVYRAFLEGDRVSKFDATLNEVPQAAGKRIYLKYCSYCHGYTGDGRTAAAQVLDPKPRDLTGLPRVGVAEVVAAVNSGRKGTAMPSFAKVLKKAEIDAVAAYVTQRLAGRNDVDGRYHTSENGWPDHDTRYGPALPFVLGELAVDAPLSTLSPVQRNGLDLFNGACVSCHFGKRERLGATTMEYKTYKPAD